ncbi:MAG: hypothetical protein LBN98_06625, partial [Prevotellaceae bacterium]|nr:hypothetical protein [Prevotellaceae bacterium]
MQILAQYTHNFRLFLLWVVVLSGSIPAFGQRYPIQVTATLTPPYSLRLSDYGRMGSQQLTVTIMVHDVTIDNLPVKLHIKM